MDSFSQDAIHAFTTRHAELTDRIVMSFMRTRGGNQRTYEFGGFQGVMRDVMFNVNALANSVAADEPALFSDHIVATTSALRSRGIPPEHMVSLLEVTSKCLHEVVPEEHANRAVDFIEHAVSQLADAEEPATFMQAAAPFAGVAQEYFDALVAGNCDSAEATIFRALGLGMHVQEIYMHVLQPAQWELGRAWQANEVSVAKEHYCTACTRSIMAQLSSTLAARDHGRRVVAICVVEELHDLGLAMVCDFLRMAGWRTFFVGANLPTDEIVRALTEQKTDVLSISATMVAHLRWVSAIVDLVRACEQCRDIPILVGGRPFLIAHDLWGKVGADGWAPDAAAAVPAAEQLVSPVASRS